MKKMITIQKALRELDVKFEYEENKDEDTTTITFKDSLEDEYEIVAQDLSSGKVYYVDGDIKDTQKEIVAWIDRNKTLLTNREASIEIRDRLEQARKEYEEGQEVVDEKEFSSGNYTLKVTKRKNGHVELSIDRNTRDRYVPYMYVGKNDNGEETVSIGTVSYGTLDVEEGEIFIKEWSKALETAKHFENIIKKI